MPRNPAEIIQAIIRNLEMTAGLSAVAGRQLGDELFIAKSDAFREAIALIRVEAAEIIGEAQS